MSLLIIVVLLLLVFGGSWGGYSRFGWGGGFGIGGVLLVILVIWLLVGHGRF